MEMRVAIDTNRLTDLFRGDPTVADSLGNCEEVWIRLMVLGEIKAGFYGGTQRLRNETLIRKTLASRRTAYGRETAEQYAQVLLG
jgi:predicted nucleic acid-binding protein